jgi:ABC-type glycerol-3-phosphate transport system substrate-binding protein
MRPWHYSRNVVMTALLLMLTLVSACGSLPLGLGPSPEPLTLYFAYRQGIVNYKPLLEAFHAQNPTITVEAVELDRFGNSMESAIRNDKRIDLFRDDRRALQDAQAGLLSPLTELIRDDWDSIRDDYFKGTWNALSIRGQQWGIPASVDLLVSYINKDQSAALKIAEPAANWNLQDFLELANKMNYPEGAPYEKSVKLFGFCTVPDSIDPVVFCYARGGKIVDSLTDPTDRKSVV